MAFLVVGRLKYRAETDRSGRKCIEGQHKPPYVAHSMSNLYIVLTDRSRQPNFAIGLCNYLLYSCVASSSSALVHTSYEGIYSQL